MTNRTFSRRTFLAASAAACATAALGDDKPLILGSGEHRYECIHDWGALPKEIVYGITHGVAVDSQSNVYVLHTSRKDNVCKDCVVVFDARGKFVRSWGETFIGSAHGFDLVVEDGKELFYVTDMQRGLYKTTLDGKVIWHVPKIPFYEGKVKDGKPLRYTPTNVAIAPDGKIFFADGYGSWYIHILDKSGNYIKTFGGNGSDEKATIHPHGLYVDQRGREPLLVLAENDPGGKKPGRLHAFDMDGNHHSYLETKVRSPRHFDRRENLVVIPDLDAVVTLLDEKNQIVTQLGDGFTTMQEVRTLRTKPREQFIPGKFVCPHDAAFDKDGSIFVAEWVEVGRVTKLKKV